MKNRTYRIQYYEAIFSEAVKAVHELSSTLENYKQMQNKIAELEAYYESDAWMEDYAEESLRSAQEARVRGFRALVEEWADEDGNLPFH